MNLGSKNYWLAGQNVGQKREETDKEEFKKKIVTNYVYKITMYLNGNFDLVFGRGEILLTYMIFVYHWTS